MQARTRQRQASFRVDGLKEEREQNNAATVLQSRVRGRQTARETASKIEDQKQNGAATMLQARTRQRQAAARTGAIRDEKEAQRQDEAAVTLQARMRGRRASLSVEQMKEEKRQNSAATSLQARARQRQASSQVEELRTVRAEERQQDAATLLQAKARQRQASFRVDAVRAEEGERQRALEGKAGAMQSHFNTMRVQDESVVPPATLSLVALTKSLAQVHGDLIARRKTVQQVEQALQRRKDDYATKQGGAAFAPGVDDDVLTLSVGGRRIKASRAALSRAPGSRLAYMFGGGRFDRVLPCDSRGRIFLDLDANLFTKLLDFLSDTANQQGSGHRHLVIRGDEAQHIHLSRIVDYLGLRKFVFGGTKAEVEAEAEAEAERIVEEEDEGEEETDFDERDVQGLANRFLRDGCKEEVELTKQVRGLGATMGGRMDARGERTRTCAHRAHTSARKNVRAHTTHWRTHARTHANTHTSGGAAGDREAAVRHHQTLDGRRARGRRGGAQHTGRARLHPPRNALRRGGLEPRRALRRGRDGLRRVARRGREYLHGRLLAECVSGDRRVAEAEAADAGPAAGRSHAKVRAGVRDAGWGRGSEIGTRGCSMGWSVGAAVGLTNSC